MYKESITILVFALSSIYSCVTAQNPNINIIAESAFNAITYNGHTIAEINATEGDDIAIQQLFGAYTSTKKTPGLDRLTFNYGDNSLTYFFLNDNITALEIKDSSWPVVIQGHTVKVGDTLTDLKQMFGSDLKTITSSYVSETVVSFNYQGNGIDGIHIYLDPNTEEITKIKYWVST